MYGNLLEVSGILEAFTSNAFVFRNLRMFEDVGKAVALKVLYVQVIPVSLSAR